MVSAEVALTFFCLNRASMQWFWFDAWDCEKKLIHQTRLDSLRALRGSTSIKDIS